MLPDMDPSQRPGGYGQTKTIELLRILNYGAARNRSRHFKQTRLGNSPLKIKGVSIIEGFA